MNFLFRFHYALGKISLELSFQYLSFVGTFHFWKKNSIESNMIKAANFFKLSELVFVQPRSYGAYTNLHAAIFLVFILLKAMWRNNILYEVTSFAMIKQYDCLLLWQFEALETVAFANQKFM